MTSKVTGTTYDPARCVRIFNMVQAARYLKAGAQPVDIRLENDKLCLLFVRREVAGLYRRWLCHEL